MNNNPPSHIECHAAPFYDAEEELSSSIGVWPEPTVDFSVKVNPVGSSEEPPPFQPSKRKRFACTNCDTSFDRINDLKRHQLRHRSKQLTEGEYIQCTECPMKFTRCYSFRRHCHRKHSFLLSRANIQPMKSAMTELQLQIWKWCQDVNTTIDPAVLMSTKKRRQASSI